MRYHNSRPLEAGDTSMTIIAFEVAAYDDSLAEIHDLDVGIPRAINVTDLSVPSVGG